MSDKEIEGNSRYKTYAFFIIIIGNLLLFSSNYVLGFFFGPRKLLGEGN